MAVRTISDAGGSWTTTTTWVEGSVPNSTSDVVATATSGNLTINNNASCRSLDLTGYLGTVTHNSGITLTIGSTDVNASGIALKIAGTWNLASVLNSILVLSSSSADEVTIDTGGFNVARINITSGKYKLLSNIAAHATAYITHTGGTVDTNGKSITFGGLYSTGSTTRQLNLGTSIITLSMTAAATLELDTAGLTMTANSSTIIVNGANPRIYTNGVDLNGASLKIMGAAGTCTIYESGTYNNLYILPTTTKTITFTSGTTQTFTGAIHCCGSSSGKITINTASAGSSATISKASGDVKFYITDIKDISFTGGATFNAYNSCTNVSGNSGITFNGGVWYMDEENGNDTNVTPYGWWSVAYTGATGTMPAAGDTATGATSSKTAKVNGLVNSYDWSLGSGTLYFIGVSGTFVAEQLDFSSGGHVDIAGDMVRCSWKTMTSGALNTRISPGDIMHIAKSPDPGSLGLATWTTRPYALPATFTITSSTNTTPIRITKTAHGLATGTAVYITAHTTNTAANGSWTITKITNDTFDLDNSVGNGIGGATGTVYQIDHMCVVLDTACTQTICRCGDDGNWTAGTANYTPTLLAPGTDTRREGTYCIRVAVAAGAGVNEKAAYYTLPAELDLSGYQVINFWFNTSVVLNSNDWTVCLCSDTLGATPVNIFNIPTDPNQVNEWFPVALDYGSPLGSSIKSVAVYQVVDKGAFNFHIDNIFVSKAKTASDCLTLNSVISKNSNATGGDEPFYPIMSVSKDGRVLMFKCIRNNAFNTNASYCGVTEKVNTYARLMHQVAKSPTYNSGGINVVQKSGTAENRIQYLGGYDTSTDVQNGETYIWNPSGWGYGVWSSGKSYVTISNLNPVNFYYGFILDTGSYCIIDRIQTVAQAFQDGVNINGGTGHTVNKINGVILSGGGVFINSATGIIIQTINTVHSCWTINRGLIQFQAATNCRINNQVQLLANNAQGSSGLTFTAIANANYVKGVDKIYGCDSCVWFENARFNTIENLELLTYARANHGIVFNNYSWNNVIRNVTEISHSPLYGVYFGTNSYFNRIENLLKNEYNFWAVVAVLDTNNGWDNRISNMVTTGNTNCLSIAWGGFYFRNCLFNETPFLTSALSAWAETHIHFEKHQQIADNHKLYTYGGLISSDATTRHTASDIAWSMSVTNVARTEVWPLRMVLATFAVAANAQVTFGVYCKKSHATDIGAKISCRANQLSGMPDYIETTKINDTDWEQLVIQFTPTEAGVVEIEGLAWWIANTADETVWFDDITKTQA
jgi:hypothetical protein